MVMIQLMEDKFSAMRREYEYSKQFRYEELLTKYIKKQQVSAEKRNEFKNKLRQRSLSSYVRHVEAAIRRKCLYEEKGKRIIERKSQCANRFKRSNSCADLRLGLNTELLSNLSKNFITGTAGFGKGYGRKSNELFYDCKIGTNIINTSIYKKHLERRSNSLGFTCSTNSTSSLLQLDTELLSEMNSKKQRESIYSNKGSCTTDDDDIITEIMVDAQDYDTIPNTREVTRGFRKKKKVCFNASKYSQTTIKPLLKKSILLATPETKKGILQRMSSRNSKQPNTGYPLLVPVFHSRDSQSELTSEDISIEGKGDDSRHSSPDSNPHLMINKETNTDPIKRLYTICSITTFFGVKDITENVALTGCEPLLRTCELEHMNRRLKLAKLHSDLKTTEIETNILKAKNEEVTKKLIYKLQRPLTEKEENVYLESITEKCRNKVVTRNVQSSLATVEPIFGDQHEHYWTDIRFKRYKPILDYNNSSKVNLSKTEINVPSQMIQGSKNNYNVWTREMFT